MLTRAKFGHTTLFLLLVSVCGCDSIPDKPDAIGEGSVSINEIVFDIDFASVNGPYLTFGCTNSIQFQIWYGSTSENLNTRFEADTTYLNTDGTFSNVTPFIQGDRYCAFYGEIGSGSFINAEFMGGNRYNFYGEVQLSSCQSLSITIQYEGELYFEDPNCYGCDRPCSNLDDPFANEESSELVHSVSRQQGSGQYFYNEGNQLALFAANNNQFYRFNYENGELEAVHFTFSETISRDITSDGGRIVKMIKTDISPISVRSYFDYDIANHVQQIDSATSFDPAFPTTVTFREHAFNDFGNLVQSFAIADNDTIELVEYEYDNQLNPFFGMYHTFAEAFTPLNSVNNVTLRRVTDFVNPERSRESTFSYTYDGRGLPITVNSNIEGSGSIKYYTYDF